MILRYQLSRNGPLVQRDLTHSMRSQEFLRCSKSVRNVIIVSLLSTHMILNQATISAFQCDKVHQLFSLRVSKREANGVIHGREVRIVEVLSRADLRITTS